MSAAGFSSPPSMFGCEGQKMSCFLLVVSFLLSHQFPSNRRIGTVSDACSSPPSGFWPKRSFSFCFKHDRLNAPVFFAVFFQVPLRSVLTTGPPGYGSVLLVLILVLGSFYSPSFKVPSVLLNTLSLYLAGGLGISSPAAVRRRSP